MPVNLNLAGWKTTATTALINTLPLQTFDNGLLLVDQYLASVGGWTPDSELDPTGPGVPVNGATPAEAATAIATTQLSRVYRLTGTMSVEINLDYIASFAPGQSDDDIRAQMQPLIQAFIEERLASTQLSFVGLSGLSGDITDGGETTAAERRALLVALTNNAEKSDPRALALRAATTLYQLPSTWSVQSVYTETGKPIVVTIRKYTNTQFTALDNTTTVRYVMTVSPDTYTVTAGSISSIVA